MSVFDDHPRRDVEWAIALTIVFKYVRAGVHARRQTSDCRLEPSPTVVERIAHGCSESIDAIAVDGLVDSPLRGAARCDLRLKVSPALQSGRGCWP